MGAPNANGLNKKGQGGKDKFNCAKIKQKYPVESYDEQTKRLEKEGITNKQSHHVMQNALFSKPRKVPVEGIFPKYNLGDAPCIPLSGDADPETEHGKVSQMQTESEQQYRDNNKNPTYKDARNDAKQQLKAKPKPKMSDQEAECILKEVDKYFRKISGKNQAELNKTELRTPHERSAWQPNSVRAGMATGSPMS